MSLGVLTAFISKLSLMGTQILEPAGNGSAFLMPLKWLGEWIWQGLCLAIYGLVKWMLAFVDFMQYFVQKLIGLDYWLNRTHYTLEGAVESDIIFGFLYNDTVQKVFRAMVAIFFVLLIIFTIYAIVKSEWEHIAGKGGKFGDGVGNSKNKIFKSSLKAIAMVMIFPIILMIGIISTNAILASLIKALNIDTSSTLGGQIFQIASQTANKHQIYAQGADGRNAVSDQVSFYIYGEKYLTMKNPQGDTALVENADTYEEFLEKAGNSTKYTVKTVFDKIEINAGGDLMFNGYLAKLKDGEEPLFILAQCGTSSDANVVNSKPAMYYYLRNVLQVPIVTTSQSFGFDEHDDIKNNLTSGLYEGFISDLNLNNFYNNGNNCIVEAAYNTWNYASIYAETFDFEEGIDFVPVIAGTSVNMTGDVIGGEGGTAVSSSLTAFGLESITSAKILFNSNRIAPYFDGGMFGVAQLQAEYMVMSEVINFINQNDFRLHILDITSNLIDWSGQGSYKVEDKWIAMTSGYQLEYKKIADGETKDDEVIPNEVVPFVVSYSENCNETEMGNALYFGSKTAGGNELDGSKYIMCIKVENASGNAKYIPLVNNKTYTDPITGKMYNFKSDYYTSGYHGVVIAKGLMDSTHSNASRGEPTYFKNGNSESEVDAGAPYYYDTELAGTFNQFGANIGLQSSNQDYVDHAISNSYTIESVTISDLSNEQFSYAIVDRMVDDGSGTGTNVASSNHEYKIRQFPAGGALDGEGSSDIALTIDHVVNIGISLKKGTNASITAKYAGISNGDYHLFTYLHDGKGYYFIVHGLTAESYFEILSYSEYDPDNDNTTDNSVMKWLVCGDGVDLNATTYYYHLKYDFVYGAIEEAGKVLYGEIAGNAQYFTPNHFVWKNGDMFSTADAHTATITDTTVTPHKIINKTSYFSVNFNTNGKKDIVTLNVVNGEVSIDYAEMHQAGATIDERNADGNIQRVQTIKFKMYDFYTYYHVDNIYKYNIGKTGNESYSSAGDCIQEIEINIDSNDFSFPATETQLHLFNGKIYVATIYKYASSKEADKAKFELTSVLEIESKTAYIKLEGVDYYNVRTQNSYKYRTEEEATSAGQAYERSDVAELRYTDVQESAVIQCVRKNRGYVFIDFMFGWKFPVTFRFKIAMFNTRMRGDLDTAHEIKLTEGIKFDYFFEDTARGDVKNRVSLSTYYVPSEISYWIIFISCMLMLKVLGTAIWGVIKRIYEITLFFIAMPAVASTIPLDDGSRFDASITKPLIGKVFSTYGTMLGINVFFILLYPVKSLSKIFTAADIATSDSYFLRNFMKLIFKSYQTRADLLNLYVYILFVLVAFTMISSLPQIITQMMGTGSEDISKSGESVKKDAMGTLKSAADFVSGKSAIDTVGKVGNWAQDTVPGRLVDKIKNKGKKDASSVKDDYDDEEKTEEGKEKTTKSREEEEADEAAEAEVQGSIDSAVAGATGGKYNTYAEAMASGDADAMKTAEAARQEVENQIAEESPTIGADGKQVPTARQQALERIKAREAAGDEGEEETTGEGPEGEKSPEQKAEDIAQKTFEGGMDNMAAVVGADAEKMQTSAARSMVASGAEGSSAIVKSAFAKKADGSALGEGETADISGKLSEESREEAILSTLDPTQRAAYEAMSPKQRKAFLSDYDVQATVDAEGNVSMTAGKKGGEMKAVNGNLVNGIVAKSLTDEQVSAAAQNGDVSKAITAFTAGNIAAAVKFDDPNDAIADQITRNVMANPGESQNGAVIDRAVMDMINADPAKLKTFMKFTGLSAEQAKDPEKMMKAISQLRKGGLSIESLGIKPEDYQGFVAGAIQTNVANGSFKVTAWDMAKTNAPTAVQDLVDKAAEEGMIKSSDELELEESKSRELAQNASAEALFYIMKNSGNINAGQAQMMFDKLIGIDGEGKEGKIDEILKNVDEATIKRLTLQGRSREDIARAYALASKVGDAGKFEEYFSDKLDSEKLGEQYMNIIAAESQTVEGKKVIGESFGKDSKIFTADELGDIRTTYASNAFIGMSEDDQAAFLEKAKAAGYTEEEAKNLSLYEIDNVNNGKTKRESYDALRKENKINKAVEAAMDSEGVSDEAIKAFIDSEDIDPEIKKAFMDAYSARMKLTTEADEVQAEGDAEKQVIIDHILGKKRAEMQKERYDKELVDGNGKPLTGKAREEKKKEIDAKIEAELEEYKASQKLDEKDSTELYAMYTGKDVKEVDSEMETEADQRVIAFVRDKVGGKKFNKAMKAWLERPENKNKTEEDFLYAVAHNEGKVLDELGFDAGEGNSKLNALREKYKKDKFIGMAQETFDGFEDLVDEKKEKILETKNQEKIKSGEADIAFAFADEMAKPENTAKIKQAADLYKQMYGKDLEKEDEFVRATFLYSQFYGKEGFEDMTKNAEAARNSGLSAERVGAVVDFMKSYDGGASGNDAAEKIKMAVMRAEVERNGGIDNIQLAIDPEKLDGEARKKFELNQSILQTEIRSNPEVMANLFRNNTILGQDKIIAELAKAQGIVLEYDETGKITGGSYTDEKGETVSLGSVDEIKQRLNSDAIVAYMNSHEETKNKLVNIGAQNMITALDQDSQDAKKVDAILNAPYLRNQVADKTLEKMGITDKSQIEALIKQMLEAEGRLSGDDEKDAKFIAEHFNELKTEVSLHFAKNDKGGYDFQAAGKNASAFIDTMKEMEQSDKDFKMNVGREVTQMIDPSRYDPETSTQEFFAARSIDEFVTQDNTDLSRMSGAIDKFFSKGFKGFSPDTRVLVETIKGSKALQVETMREMVSDEELLKHKETIGIRDHLKDDDLFKAAQKDAFMLARFGGKIDATNKAEVIAYLKDSKNEKELSRIKDAAAIEKLKARKDGEYDKVVRSILVQNGKVKKQDGEYIISDNALTTHINNTEKRVKKVESDRVDEITRGEAELREARTANENAAKEREEKRVENNKVDATARTVENIEIFKAFEKNEEAKKAFEAKTGKSAATASYAEIMKFIAADGDKGAGLDLREKLVTEARTNLPKDYKRKRRDSKAKIAKAIEGNTRLEMLAYGANITDADIIKHGNLDKITVDYNEVLNAAAEDDAVKARLGLKKIDLSNAEHRAKLEAYLKDNDGAEQSRIETGLKVKAVRGETSAMKKVMKAKTKVDPSSVKVTDEDYREYAETHASEIKITDGDRDAYVRNNDKLLDKVREKMGLGPDGVVEEHHIQAYYKRVSDAERKKIDLGTRLAVISKNDGLKAKVREEKAQKLSEQKESKLMFNMFGGETLRVKRAKMSSKVHDVFGVTKAWTRKKLEDTKARYDLANAKRENSIKASEKSAENVEIYKAFVADKDKYKEAFEKANPGKKIEDASYEDVMKFLAAGNDDESHARRVELREQARVNFAKLHGIEYDPTNKDSVKALNSKMSTTKKSVVEKSISSDENLRSQVYNNTVTGNDIDKFISDAEVVEDLGGIEAYQAKVIETARNDEGIKARFGDNATKEQIEAYLNENKKELERIAKKTKVEHVQNSPKLMKKAFSAKVSKYAESVKPTDTQIQAYAETHAAEIAISDLDRDAYVRGNDALLGKVREKMGLGPDGTVEEQHIQAYYKSVSNEERKEIDLGTRVAAISKSKELQTKVKEEIAETELTTTFFSGKSKEVRNYKKTESKEISNAIKTGLTKKEDAEEAHKAEIEKNKIDVEAKTVENIEIFKAFDANKEKYREAFEKANPGKKIEDASYEDVMKFLAAGDDDEAHARRVELRTAAMVSVLKEIPMFSKQLEEAEKAGISPEEYIARNKKLVEKRIGSTMKSTKSARVARAMAGSKKLTAEAQMKAVSDEDIEAYIDSDAGKADERLKVGEDDLIAAVQSDAFAKGYLGDKITDIDAVREFYNKKEHSERIAKKAKIIKARKNSDVMAATFEHKVATRAATIKVDEKPIEIGDEDYQKYVQEHKSEFDLKEAGNKSLTSEYIMKSNSEIAIQIQNKIKAKTGSDKINESDLRKMIRDPKRLKYYGITEEEIELARMGARVQIAKDRSTVKDKIMEGKLVSEKARQEAEKIRLAREQVLTESLSTTKPKSFVKPRKTRKVEKEGYIAKKNEEETIASALKLERDKNSINTKQTTVEHIELFKAFEKDDEAMQAFNATGQTFNYQNVMQFLARSDSEVDNHELRKKLKGQVAEKAQKEGINLKSRKGADIAKAVGDNKTLRDSVVTDRSIIDFLNTHGSNASQFGKHLSTEGLVIKDETGKTTLSSYMIDAIKNDSKLRDRYGNASDETIIAAWNSGAFDKKTKTAIKQQAAMRKFHHISDDELATRALQDETIRSKLGKNATKKDYLKYLSENASEKTRIENQIKVDRARGNGALMDKIKQIGGGKNSPTAGDVEKYFSKSNPFKRYRRSEKQYEFGVEQPEAEEEKGPKAPKAEKTKLPRELIRKPKQKIAMEETPVQQKKVVGQNGVIFRMFGKLPKMCSQYENWNKIIEHKITEVKNNTNLTRTEKEKQIKILESQKIYVEKPKGYKNLSPDDQNAFDLEQDKLKRSALRNRGLVKYIKSLDKVQKAKNPDLLGLTGFFKYIAHPVETRKKKHLDDFRHVNDQARRFRATAAMRNHQKDFGDEFEEFAKTFMSKKRYHDMVRRYKLKSAVEYQKLGAQEKEKERRKREQALASQIARLQRVTGKKVARDNDVDKKSFLAERGVVSDLLRYKNGMSKFTENSERKTKLKHREKVNLKDNHKIMEAQNKAAIIDRTMQELVKFSASYKGSSADFARELRAYADKLGVDNRALIDKIYKKYASLFKGGLGRLENSPVAVQQRNLMKSLMDELKKCQQRVTLNGKIPASIDIANAFVGKSFSGSTTIAQKQINRDRADEYSRIVKLIKDQKNFVSFESLKSRITPSLMEEFMNKHKNIMSKSESAKKAALESFFEKRLRDALVKVHNDQYSKSDKSQLEKLNGRRVKKSEIDNSRRSHTMQESMKTADNPIYQKIVREYNSASEKYKLEKFNHDELQAALAKLRAAPRTPANITKTIEMKKALEQSRIKLNALQKVLDSAKARKHDYEQSFARTQIQEAKAVSKALGYSRSSSVLDRYNFPKADGTMVAKGTQDAKQVQMLVSNYIQQYRQTVETMVRNETVRASADLEKYLSELRSKFTADFGRNLKYSKELKAQLTARIAELEAKHRKLKTEMKGDDLKLKETLQKGIQDLTKSEELLRLKFRDMKVKVEEISLKR